jgi:hypothetical protein
MMMRKIVFTLFVLVSMVGMVYSQGNLQFNQVIEVRFTGANTIGPSSFYVQSGMQAVNVPVGKVWKIESVTANITRGTLNSNTYTNFLMNGGVPLIYMDEALISASVSTTNAFVIPHQIYWIGAGNHNFYMHLPTVLSPVTYTYTATITALEFNVVP